jgi:hypothetical protein
MLGIAGSALTFAGSAAAWWFDEERRLRRMVRRALGGEPDGVIIARGRDAAAGFRLASEHIVVMRDGGARALLYTLRTLIGAELIIDGQVAARAIRDEPRRALDHIASAANRVTLRLVFDDPRHPDFDLDLWLPEDDHHRDTRPPSEAIREARGWLARVEALLRRAGPAVEDPRVAEAPIVEDEIEHPDPQAMDDDPPF